MTPQEIWNEVAKSGGIISPTEGDVHVNKPLTNILIAYVQDAMGFVADRAFQVLPVQKKSDDFFTIPRDAWFRDDMEERRPSTESAGVTYEVETDSYRCTRYALHNDIDDEIRSNSDRPLNLDRQATMLLGGKALLRRERNWALKYLADSVWTFSVDGANAATSLATFDMTVDANNQLQYWSEGNSTPIEDIKLIKRGVQEHTGYRPNVLAIGRPVYDTLTDHPDIIDRLNRGQTTGPAQANMDDIMRLLELDDLLIMDGIHNGAKLGASWASTFIGGKDGLLFYRPPEPGIMIPAAGYTFAWRGFIGGGTGDGRGNRAVGMRTRRIRMEHLTSDRVEVEQAFDQRQVAADLGIFLDGIVA